MNRRAKKLLSLLLSLVMLLSLFPSAVFAEEGVAPEEPAAAEEPAAISEEVPEELEELPEEPKEVPEEPEALPEEPEEVPEEPEALPEEPDSIPDGAEPCGSNLGWWIEDDTLYISGTGEMWEYGDNRNYPWYDAWFGRIVIGEGVSSVGSNAFRDRVWQDHDAPVYQLYLPSTLERVGAEAFFGCLCDWNSSCSVTIPAALSDIGFQAFNLCPSVSEFIVEEGNPNYRAIDGVLVNMEGTELLAYPCGSDREDYYVPYGIEMIEESAMRDTVHLRTVHIPETVTSIGSWSFVFSHALTDFHVADENPSYSAIDGLLYSKDGTRLVSFPSGRYDERLEIPEGTAIIGELAFHGTSNVYAVFPASLETVEQWALSFAGDQATFVFRGDAPSFDPESFQNTTAIAYYPEGNATWTEELRQSYGGTVSWLPGEPDPSWEAHGPCGDSLIWFLQDNTLTIRGSGEMWDYGSNGDFPWCYWEFDRIVIEEGVTSVANQAFRDRQWAVHELSLPSTLQRVGEGAFFNCFSDENEPMILTIPSALTDIGFDAFNLCRAVTAFEVEEGNPNYISVDGVLYSADGCVLHAYPANCGREHYDIPEGTKVLLGSCLRDAIGLRSVYLPASVESINDWTFVCCPDLRDFEVDEGNSNFSARDGMLYTKDGTKLLSMPGGRQETAQSLPEGTLLIGTCALHGAWNLTLTLPASLDRVDDWGFFSCGDRVTFIFTGDAPRFEAESFRETRGVAYFPAGNATWTEEVRQSYGGSIVWLEGVPDENWDASGVCGDELVWFLQGDTLTVRGTGEMWNFDDYNSCPWHDWGFTRLVIEEGVTSIGNWAFAWNHRICEVSLPDSLELIGFYAFRSSFASYDDFHEEARVHIPENVNLICSGAFTDCERLAELTVAEESIFYRSDGGVLLTKSGNILLSYLPCLEAEEYTVPDTVAYIDDWAFQCNHSLRRVDLPEGLENLGIGAFRDCWSLTEINIPDGSTYYRSIDGVLYTADGKDLVVLPSGQRGGMVRLADGVERIADGALDWNSSLILPASFRSVNSDAFRWNGDNISLCFLGNAPEFWDDCFEGSTITVWYPAGNDSWNAVVGQSFGGNVHWVEGTPDESWEDFGSCGDDLLWIRQGDLLTIRGSGDMWNLGNNWDYVWNQRDRVHTLVVEEGVTSIGNWAFQDYEQFTEVSLPSTLRRIGDYAFRRAFCWNDWDQDVSLTIPASVEEIGDGALTCNDRLRELVVDEGNPHFYMNNGVLFSADGSRLLARGTNLEDEEYTVPASVTQIDGWAFSNNGWLRRVNLPAGLEVLGEAALRDAWNLEEILIPEGNPFFRSIDGLLYSANGKVLIAVPDAQASRGVTLAEGVETIREMAFRRNAHATLPASFKALHSGVFTWNGDAIMLTFLGDAPEFDDNCFEGSTVTVWYPAGNDSWNGVVGRSFGGEVTWIEGEPDPDLVATGKCGDSLYLWLYRDELIISGEGDMWDYQDFEAPWFNFDRVARLTVLEGVTSIGSNAFHDYEGLSEVELPESLVRVGGCAFYRAFVWSSREVSLRLPASLTQIDYAAFCDNDRLESITVAEGNPRYSSEDGVLFDDAERSLLTYPGARPGDSYAVPGGVEVIEEWAFGTASNLRSIRLAGSVHQVHAFAFAWCYKLEEITVHEANPSYCAVDGVLYEKDMKTLVAYPDGLGGRAFTIPESVERVERGAFVGANDLLLTVPGTARAFGPQSFWCCQNLNLFFRGDAPELGENLFDSARVTAWYPAGNGTWTEDKLQGYGGDVTWIAQEPDAPLVSGQCGDEVFWDLYDDGRIVIHGEGPMWDFGYGETPWWSQHQLITGIVFEEGVTRSGEEAFDGCENVTDIKLTDSMRELAPYTFQGTAVTELYIPEGVEVLDDNALYSMNQLERLYLPSTLERIGEFAFARCGVLEDIWFNGTVDMWRALHVGNYHATVHCLDGDLDMRMACGDEMFWRFDEESGTITVYGTGGMWNYMYDPAPWSELREDIRRIVIEEGVNGIGDYAFYGTGVQELSLPEGLEWIGSFAFSSSDSLTGILLPASLRGCGNGFLSGCVGLTEIGLAEGNERFRLEDGILYSGDMSGLVAFPTGRTGAYTVPDSVQWVTDSCFFRSKLSELVFSDSVDFLSYSSLRFMENLTSVRLPAGLSSLENWLFLGDPALESVVIPAGVRWIGENVFWNCPSLHEITFLGDAPDMAWDNALAGVTATAYYPSTANWPADRLRGYGGSITWVPYERPEGLPIDRAHFPDDNFRSIVARFDTETDGVLSDGEIAAITEIRADGRDLWSVQGIEFFPELEVLYCPYNRLESLDVSHNPKLRDLRCGFNNLNTVDVSHNPELEIFGCSGLGLTRIDVSMLPKLQQLICYENELTELDLSHNPELSYLCCNSNPLSGLDLRSNTALMRLDCYEDGLTELDLTNCGELRELYCSNNSLSALDLSHNPALESLYCFFNNLSVLNLSGCGELRSLYAMNNRLTELDLSGCPNLELLWCFNNELAELDLSGCPRLSDDARGEFVPGAFGYPEEIHFYGAFPADLETGVGTDYRLAVDAATELILGAEPAGIRIDAEHFPDENFRAYIGNSLDPNRNGYLDDEEIAAITELYVDKLDLWSVQGIEFFPELEVLYCPYNRIESLDVSCNPKLRDLRCGYNNLSTVDVSHNPELEIFGCSGLGLTRIDVSMLPKLQQLICYENELTELDLSHNPELRNLWCYDNRLSALDLSRNPELQMLRAMNNRLTRLDLGVRPRLEALWCFGNEIAELDLSGCPSLVEAAQGEFVSGAFGFPEEAHFYGPVEYESLGSSYRLAVDEATALITVTSHLPGDANGDGEIDGRDAIRLQKYLSGQDVDIDLSSADVTGDGIVDGRDFIRLMKYLAGQDVILY